MGAPMSELWRRSASELADQIAGREVSAVDVVEAHLARIQAVNPAVNAIVRVMAEDARHAAVEADLKVAAGAPLGPLHGVPFTVKENIDVAGIPTTWGVPAFADAVAPVDAPVVERMRAAGGIVIGRTNLPDMAMREHTDSTLHGLTRNPWNRNRTAGGSSGGEAVALATGMIPLGLGNDIGGSLRNPANACGIVSIRPSFGRVPDAGVIPSEDQLLAVQLMNVQGPMARRVGDVRLALSVIMGAHPRDPWAIDAPLVGAPSRPPIHVALIDEPPGAPTDPVVAAVVRRAAGALSDAGYAVSAVCPPRYEDAIATWVEFLLGDFAAVRQQMLPLMGADAIAAYRKFETLAPPMNAAAMSAMFIRRQGIARAWSVFMAEFPLVLSPTWTQLPFELGRDGAIASAGETMRPVLPANLLGLPSVCVPAGRDVATGLPIGVLLTGQRLREDLCLDAAEVIEARLGLPTPIDPSDVRS